jgi:hypothetical protein
MTYLRSGEKGGRAPLMRQWIDGLTTDMILAIDLEPMRAIDMAPQISRNQLRDNGSHSNIILDAWRPHISPH